MKIDKQEKLWRNRKKFKKVDQILKEEFKNISPQMGLCHQVWARKTQLLKEMYDIDWKSPAKLNPNIKFD